MPNTKTETLNGYKVRASTKNGETLGRIFRNGQMVNKFQADDIASALEEAREWVESTLAARAAERVDNVPTVAEYADVLKSLDPDLPVTYRAMLVGHYAAPDHTLTATALAHLAGWKAFRSANLHFGKLGYMVQQQVQMKLDTREDGTPIYTNALAVGVEGDEDGPDFRWKMRPEVAAALEEVGWV